MADGKVDINDLSSFYARGIENYKKMLRRVMRDALRPPPRFKISEWVREHGTLSAETSATTGKIELYPYQSGILDAFGDPKNDDVSVMKSARVGYTKCLDLGVAYYIHQDPSPQLVVQPREIDAEDWSKTELVPMIRDTKVLADIQGDTKERDSGNTILKKLFRNGASVAMVGANAPGGFRRITVRCVWFDEIDGYPLEGAGKEGDQVKLGSMRSLSFWNRRITFGSTPTIEGQSRIQKLFEAGDQRYFFVPCPHCGEKQRLEFGGADLPYGFKWETDDLGSVIEESVLYLCKYNKCEIREHEKYAMIRAGAWEATKPFTGHASFHIWAAYSFFPNASWYNIIKEFLSTRGDTLLRQVFWNTWLGLPYEDHGDKAIKPSDLKARCHDWDGEVPEEVHTVTIGVDIQDYRVEYEIVGWGADEESWSLHYDVIEGGFSDLNTQQILDDILLTKLVKKSGIKMSIAGTCIDSGGHHTQAVYSFSKARLARKVWAIKGDAERVGGKRKPVWPTTAKPSRKKKNAFSPIILGVNAAKDIVRDRLHLDKPGPGYCHFPTSRSEEYFQQLTAEKLMTKYTNGFVAKIWVLPDKAANEASDCRNYAYGALCGLKQYGLNLPERMKQLKQQQERHTAETVYDTRPLGPQVIINSPATPAAGDPAKVQGSPAPTAAMQKNVKRLA